MIHVFIRMARDALVRLPQHLVPLTENQRVRRTGLNAGRYGNPLMVLLCLDLRQRLSVPLYRSRLIGAVGAMSTLADFGCQRVPLRSRYAPGASPYAIPAADALV